MAELKFELDRLPEYTDEALLSELRRVAASIDTPTLSMQAFDRESKVVSASTVQKRFGGWGAALEAAGLADRYSTVRLTLKMKEQHGKGQSKEHLLLELRRVADLVGRAGITRDEFNNLSRFEAGTIRRRFGTWNHALREAGLEVVPHGRRYSDDECFENLLSVWTHLGRPPQHREMNFAPSRVGPKAYIRRWGTWNKTLHAFVNRVNQDTENEPAQSPALAPETAAAEPLTRRSQESEQRDIRLGLRYTVLRRDSFRCVICGASPATVLGCQLHVDHILPFAKGGKTVLENLRSLCERCNLGKGTKVEQ